MDEDVVHNRSMRRWAGVRYPRALCGRASPPETPVYVLSNALPMWAFYTTPPTGRARHGPLPLARAARWSCRPGVSQRAGPPGRLRADEAATLVGRWRARPIVGLATGLRKRDLAGLARSRPDSGWV